jgi:hypothetical protein
MAALVDDVAVAALVWLASPDGTPPADAAARLAAVHLIDPGARGLLPIHAGHTAGVAAHAARALRAATTHRERGGGAADASSDALERAAALWNEQLFFEVHEVLELVWKTLHGDRRQAFQGLIQIAVAYHHLAHGNLRGARSLLTEGRRRLGGVPSELLPSVDVEGLLAATAETEACLARHATPTEAPPRLVVGTTPAP